MVFNLHFFVLGYVCRYFLKSGHFSKQRGFVYAIMFLVGVAVASEYYNWLSRPLNFYELLDVDVDVNSADLKRAYKKMSLSIHPDKNPAAGAAEQFAYLTHAYEVLSNSEQRRLYDIFGADAVDDSRRAAERSENSLLIQSASFYIVWGVLTYIMTVGKESSNGRTWSYLALIFTAFLEFNLIFDSTFDPLRSIFRRMTRREKTISLHSLYPSFMSGAMILSVHLFQDVDLEIRSLMYEIIAQNRDLFLLLKHSVEILEKKRKNDGQAKDAAALTEDEKKGKEIIAAQPGDENLTAAQRIARMQQARERIERQAVANEKKRSGGIPGWAIMVGMYFLFNYVLKSDAPAQTHRG